MQAVYKLIIEIVFREKGAAILISQDGSPAKGVPLIFIYCPPSNCSKKSSGLS